jgi:hypothetical protein
MHGDAQRETTVFRHWRVSQGLTFRKAAELLGLSLSTVYCLDVGQRRLLKRHRLMMVAVSKGYVLEPWPPEM